MRILNHRSIVASASVGAKSDNCCPLCRYAWREASRMSRGHISNWRSREASQWCRSPHSRHPNHRLEPRSLLNVGAPVRPTLMSVIGTSTRSALSRLQSASRFNAHPSNFIKLFLRDALAPGSTPRAVLDKFAAIQMLDVHFPTTDSRTLILSRYTEPNVNQQILPERLNLTLTLPPQPPPKITIADQSIANKNKPNVVETF